jgi:uncharacterized RDD family membrane protein YckC
MAQPVPAVAPRVSEFYQRKRRLAYVFAWLSMTFLLMEASFLGSILEFTSLPRASVAEGGISLLYRCMTRDNPDEARLLQLDAEARPQGTPLGLLDAAGAVLSEGRELTVFYGNRASVMVDGQVPRSVDLGQKWDVQAAAGSWIFGWNDGKIVGRRRENGAWGKEIEIAASGLVERLVAVVDGSAGPLVAWHERDKTIVRTALFDGSTFAPRSEFDIGSNQHWTAVLSRGRILYVLYNRDDRSFRYVTLRLECCPGCPSPVASRKIAFIDPVLRVGRRVTGLTAAETGGRLRFFVTRTTTVMTGSVPMETFQPEEGARLVEIAVDPLWRNVVGAVIPIALFFCSLALVTIGITLLRERNRILVAGAAPQPPEALVVGVFPRAMAWVLDGILLLPLGLLIAGVMAVSIEEFQDPGHGTVLLLWGALEMTYRFVMEWAFGWSVGKRIVGLKVTELDGSRLTFRGAIVRNVVRLIDCSLYGVIVGIAMVLKTKRRQRLGDWLGKTMVIQDL